MFFWPMFFRSLQLLSRHLKLEKPLQSNEEQEVTLFLEPELEIILKKSSDGLWLHAKLAPLPEKNREEFISHVMSCNLFGAETGGAILGCDRQGKMLLLLRFILDGMDDDEFLLQVEEFANYADAWRAECLEFGQAG